MSNASVSLTLHVRECKQINPCRSLDISGAALTWRLSVLQSGCIKGGFCRSAPLLPSPQHGITEADRFCTISPHLYIYILLLLKRPLPTVMSSPVTCDLFDISSAASSPERSQAGPSEKMDNASLHVPTGPFEKKDHASHYVPTGPKSTSSRGHGHEFKRNPPCPFSGIPSPQTMHRHILNKKDDKKYFSITLMQPPATPWTPLPSHPNMETRTCFHTGSRVHRLDCGHTVVVARDAEPCAANCKTPMSIIPSTSSTLPAPYATPLDRLRASTVRVVQSHIELLVDAGDALAEAKFAAHAAILSKVWAVQDKTLTPPRDLISGNLSCVLCGTTGLRETRAAAVVDGAPYHCVVVGNDECDVAIVRELEKGVWPSLPSFSRGFGGKNKKKGPLLKRLGVVDDRGHRRAGAIGGVGESAGDTRRRRKDEWQWAARRREKEGVLGKLREECLMEELDGMELDG
ncbi:hypothetical protein PMIN03_001842 [Paraphaeosphaeria minitans]